MAAKNRGVGRPRTRPEGVRERKVYLTDSEFRRVSAAARKLGLSAAELTRQAILGLVSGAENENSGKKFPHENSTK